MRRHVVRPSSLLYGIFLCLSYFNPTAAAQEQERPPDPSQGVFAIYLVQIHQLKATVAAELNL